MRGFPFSSQISETGIILNSAVWKAASPLVATVLESIVPTRGRMRTFTYEEHGTLEFNIKAAFGPRVFDIWMLPIHNRIRLTEIKHEGTFEEAASLAGYDRNLDGLTAE